MEPLGHRNPAKLQTTAQRSALAERLAELTKPVEEMEDGLLASATYDGDRRLAVLKFYDHKNGRFWLWADNTGHRPYCYTRLTMEELGAVKARKDVVEVTEEERLDLLNDEKVKVRKIVATDPLAIGGGNNSIRDEIKAWEADIKYYENYAYDKGLKMGTYYRVTGGRVSPLKHPMPENVARSLETILKKNPPEFEPYLREWAELLGEPLVDFRRVAMDIEVANEEGRMPDPEDPTQPVISVSFVNEHEKLVYALRKQGENPSPSDFSLELFDDETDLIRAVFSKMLEYPVIITFNGDSFDLRYLKHRADKRRIPEEEDPIELQRVESSVKHGIHLDLYNFFKNRSIQVYAFSNKYSDYTLNTISEALIGKSKIEFEGNIGDLPLEELARYNLNDSQLTYELTSVGGSVAMKLLLVIARIGKMPMNDVGRLGVSNWIRSMLFFEHRRLGALIPRPDELSEKGGATSQAVIKGKKYKGGLVIEPKPGVYFDVSVFDFASLYPSLIKVHNLSYETVNCSHEECRSNKVPDTNSWVCSRRKGIESLVTGSLRDLRVGHYKPLTKDNTLTKEERELNNVVTQGLKVILNACFAGDTLLVTPNGLKNIKDMAVGDEVVSVNPESLGVEIDRVVEVQAFPYSGDLIHFKDKRFVDLMVTPNHRMLTADKRKSSSSGATFRTAEDVSKLTNMVIPKLKSGVEGTPPGRISLLESAKFVDAYANLYPENGMRLINWFRRLPPELRWKIREYGTVCKYWSRARRRPESHYRIPARRLSEMDIDVVEKACGRVLIGEYRSSKIPVRYDASGFASLCGWYVSEGSHQVTEPKAYVSGNYRGRTASIVISQGFGRGNPRGVTFRAEIKELLDKLGLGSIHDSADNRYHKVTSSVLHRWMVSHCYHDTTAPPNATNKRIPEFVFQSRVTMESFLESLYKGDGNRRGIRYTTSSGRLAEELVVLTTLLGSKAKMTFDGEIYRVVFKNVSSKLTFAGAENSNHVTRVPFEGMVYCVTTEKNHTVFAGRNGRFVPVGQSYGVMGFESFAFYCLPVAEATAALGRSAITKTIDKCKQLGINVLYSDTDSLFLQNPSKEQSGAVTKWAEEDLGVELDLDKSYRYVAFSSRKKNYFGVLHDGTVDIRGLTGKKSVDGQTPILARFDERVHLTTVSEAYEAFMKGRTVEVVTVSEELNTSWAPISNAMKHRVDDVYRVSTSKGRELILSGDHSVYLVDTFGRLFSKETRLLRPGDVVVGAQYVPPRSPSNHLWTANYIASPVRVNAGQVESGRLHATSGVPIPARLSLTPDFGFLLGIYAAEGDTSRREGSRNNFITQSRILNPEVCVELEHAWRNVFLMPVKVYKGQGGINSYYLPSLHAQFFRALCGGTSAEKHVPDFAFDADSAFVSAFLRAAFSGDGYGDGRRVNVASKSRPLLTGMAHLLARFDIDCRLRKFQVKGNTYHQLSVIGAFSRERFYRLIGFLQPRFNKSVGNGHRNKELIPLTTEGLLFLKKSMALRRQVHAFRGVNLHDRRYYNLSMLNAYNAVIGSLLQVAEPDERRPLVAIARMLNVRDVSYDEVVSVRRLRGSRDMFDFSVPGFERFVAGNLPTLLHNSQTPEFLKKNFYDALDILSSVKSPDDFERARAKTRELLTNMVNNLKGKRVPVADLAFNVMMGKPTAKYSGTTPQHVRAAQALEQKGREIKAGDIIGYVKTKSPPYVKPVELAKADDVDPDKYIEYAHSMFDQMLDALDFSFDEIMGATTLDFFWS